MPNKDSKTYDEKVSRIKQVSVKDSEGNYGKAVPIGVDAEDIRLNNTRDLETSTVFLGADDLAPSVDPSKDYYIAHSEIANEFINDPNRPLSAALGNQLFKEKANNTVIQGINETVATLRDDFNNRETTDYEEISEASKAFLRNKPFEVVTEVKPTTLITAEDSLKDVIIPYLFKMEISSSTSPTPKKYTIAMRTQAEGATEVTEKLYTNIAISYQELRTKYLKITTGDKEVYKNMPALACIDVGPEPDLKETLVFAIIEENPALLTTQEKEELGIYTPQTRCIFAKMPNNFKELEIQIEGSRTYTKVLNKYADAFQGDWNQNDLTQINYIKNRPFYTEKTDLGAKSLTIELSSNNLVLQLPGSGGYSVYKTEYGKLKPEDHLRPTPLTVKIPGEPELKINAVIYRMSAEEFPEMEQYYGISEFYTIAIETGDPDYPYEQIIYLDTSLDQTGDIPTFNQRGYISVLADLEGGTLTIENMPGENASIIHPVPNKYLPTVDWEKIDNEDKGTIRNKPFGTYSVSNVHAYQSDPLSYEKDQISVGSQDIPVYICSGISDLTFEGNSPTKSIYQNLIATLELGYNDTEGTYHSLVKNEKVPYVSMELGYGIHGFMYGDRNMFLGGDQAVPDPNIMISLIYLYSEYGVSCSCMVRSEALPPDFILEKPTVNMILSVTFEKIIKPEVINLKYLPEIYTQTPQYLSISKEPDTTRINAINYQLNINMDGILKSGDKINNIYRKIQIENKELTNHTQPMVTVDSNLRYRIPGYRIFTCIHNRILYLLAFSTERNTFALYQLAEQGFILVEDFSSYLEEVKESLPLQTSAANGWDFIDKCQLVIETNTHNPDFDFPNHLIEWNHPYHNKMSVNLVNTQGRGYISFQFLASEDQSNTSENKCQLRFFKNIMSEQEYEKVEPKITYEVVPCSNPSGYEIGHYQTGGGSHWYDPPLIYTRFLTSTLFHNGNDYYLFDGANFAKICTTTSPIVYYDGEKGLLQNNSYFRASLKIGMPVIKEEPKLPRGFSIGDYSTGLIQYEEETVPAPEPEPGQEKGPDTIVPHVYYYPPPHNEKTRIDIIKTFSVYNFYQFWNSYWDDDEYSYFAKNNKQYMKINKKTGKIQNLSLPSSNLYSGDVSYLQVQNYIYATEIHKGSYGAPQNVACFSCRMTKEDYLNKTIENMQKEIEALKNPPQSPDPASTEPGPQA